MPESANAKAITECCMIPNKIKGVSIDQQVWPLLMVVFFISSVVVGTLNLEALYNGPRGDLTPATIGWLLLGLASFHAFRKAFAASWKAIIWFVGAFFFQLVGVSVYAVADEPSNFALLIIFFCVFLSFATLSSFIWHFKDLRDRLIIEEEMMFEYIPLGLWSMEVLFSGILILGALGTWGDWAAENGSELVLYILFMASFAFLLSHLFTTTERVENNFRELLEARGTKMKEEKAKLKSMKKAGITPVKPVASVPEGTCPVCGMDVLYTKKKCANCGLTVDFKWCPQSEEFVVDCPYCRTPTPYGREHCIHCSKPLRTLVRCSCGTENPLSEWLGGEE